MTQDTRRKLRFFFRNIAVMLAIVTGSLLYAILLQILPLVWSVVLVALTLAGGIGYFAWTEAEYKLMCAKMEEERTARYLARDTESL